MIIPASRRRKKDNPGPPLDDPEFDVVAPVVVEEVPVTDSVLEEFKYEEDDCGGEFELSLVVESKRDAVDAGVE